MAHLSVVFRIALAFFQNKPFFWEENYLLKLKCENILCYPSVGCVSAKVALLCVHSVAASRKAQSLGFRLVYAKAFLLCGVCVMVCQTQSLCPRFIYKHFVANICKQVLAEQMRLFSVGLLQVRGCCCVITRVCCPCTEFESYKAVMP